MTKQNKGRKLFAVSASAALVASAIVPVASAAFSDQEQITWGQEYVDYVVDNGLMTGNADGSFAPNGTFTRAQAAQVIVNYLGLDTEDTEAAFNDVVEGKWYYGAVNAVAAAGLVNGVGNGNFAPEQPLSRQDAAKLFGEVLGLDPETADLSVLDQFNDADKIYDYADEYIAIFVEAGVINGKGEGFDPAGLITRQELAKIVALAVQADEAGELDAYKLDAGEPEPTPPTVDELVEAVTTALADLPAVEEVTAETAEEAQAAVDAAQEAIDAAQAALDAAIEAEELTEEEVAQAEAAIAAAQAQVDAVQAAIDAIPEEVDPSEASIEAVSATNATTVEVTFSQSLASLPAASEFSIPGIDVKSAAFKEDTNSKVVVLTTTTQSAQNYTLTYNGQDRVFVGKTNLGTVLLTASAYEVEIVPSENKLPSVDISAKLENFPEGAEAVIEFTTTFGKVVKVQTTQGGVAKFQLTPLETLTSQTAIVSGIVTEVKNPTTGKTYPEYKNSVVGSVNVKFNIKEDSSTEQIQSFKVNTAYADQADRVYMKISGGVTGKIQSALDYQTPKLIAATNSEVKKELYRDLHDVLFSRIQDAVVAGTTSADVAKTKENLRTVFNGVTSSDLRNILYNATIGGTAPATEADNDYWKLAKVATNNEKLAWADASKVLYDEVTAISNEELEGILSYYRLLSKFAVLNNIKDTAAPQAPNAVFAVEHVYAEGDALVLVLPTDRSTEARNYVTQKHNQARDKDAKFLTDNASHQVLFVNDTNTDRYEITGDPTFKLEDTTAVKLIAVQNGRYKVQSTTTNTVVPQASLGYCQIPFAVSNTTSGGVTGGNQTGGQVVTTPYSYNGGVKFSATSYAISDVYRPYDIAEGVTGVDKLGEIKVVFSESVTLEDATSQNSVLNAKNWTFDGIQLDEIASKYNVNVDVRMTSTDATKQLRDVAVLTFTTNALATDAGKRDLRAFQTFLEQVTGSQHKLEVRNVGDWAAETDKKNEVPTQSLDFAGLANPEAWTPVISLNNGTTTSADATTVEIAKSNAFITRAIATDDTVYILFSEPMKIDGTDSILEKANYRINGLELPVDGSSIKRGVPGLVDSTCGVTIQLPAGYLQGKGEHVISVSNVKGYNYSVVDGSVLRTAETTTVEERVQTAYARQYTVIPGEKFKLNGNANATGLFTSINTIEGNNTAEARVYKDAAGNAIDITNWANGVNLVDFFTQHPAGTVAQ